MSPYLFNLHAEYIMSAWINHKLESTLLRELSIITDYADDTTLVGESIEELNTLLKMKE